MKLKVVLSVLAVVLAIGLLGGVGVALFSAGVSHGVSAGAAGGGELGPGQGPAPLGHIGGWRPWGPERGPGFAPWWGWWAGPLLFLRPLFGLIWIVVLILVVRALFTGGPGWARGPWSQRCADAFEDWHRRAHGDPTPPASQDPA